MCQYQKQEHQDFQIGCEWLGRKWTTKRITFEPLRIKWFKIRTRETVHPARRARFLNTELKIRQVLRHWRTDAEAEAPVLWPLDGKSRLTGEDLMLGRTEGRRRKEATEDETVGRHHRLNGHAFKQAPGDGDGQGSLVCCSPWGYKELDTTGQLNWIEAIVLFFVKKLTNHFYSG